MRQAPLKIEDSAGPRSAAAEGVPGGVLGADDIGPKVRQQPPGKRERLIGQVENDDARERHGHSSLRGPGGGALPGPDVRGSIGSLRSAGNRHRHARWAKVA